MKYFCPDAHIAIAIRISQQLCVIYIYTYIPIIMNLDEFFTINLVIYIATIMVYSFLFEIRN